VKVEADLTRAIDSVRVALGRDVAAAGGRA
jgi:hypothetical protein